MFKDKYQYTCPDVMHLIDRNKKTNRQILGWNLFFLGVMMVLGVIAQKKLDDEIENYSGPEED